MPPISKKSANDSAINVVFVPRTAFLKWVGELSVLSVSLQLSRPSKESHPFKHLRLNGIDDAVWGTEVQENILEKYPADVIRLISISPDLDQAPLEKDGAEQFEVLVEKYNKKYKQLRNILNKTNKLLVDVQNNIGTDCPGTLSFTPDEDVSDELPEQDLHAISLTNQFLSEYEAAYKQRDYYNMWQLIYNFCKKNLRDYSDLCRTDITDAAQRTLTSIYKVVIQRIAPILPYLAEEIYAEAFFF